jgi:PEP-CTERM motif
LKKLLLSIGLLAAPLACYGDVPLWEFTTPGNSFTNGSWDFGNVFTVGSSNVVITELGYYDDGDGLISPHDVGIYNFTTGNLLASTTVTNADPLTGHFNYAPIAPLTLLAGGEYEIVGVSGADNYTWNDPGFASNSSITYVGNTWQFGSSLAFMNFLQNDLSDGYWGPDAMIATDPTPEPATITLLGAVLACLAVFARRRASAKAR